jgi:hypothetical protein
MKYTVRYCHLEAAPDIKPGDIIRPGDVIGKMGSTGQSNAAHLHIDCVEGDQRGDYTLAMIEKGNPRPAPLRQINYFIDNLLYEFPIVITTYYADPDYLKLLDKIHYGYDVVPKDRHETDGHKYIHWNRSMPGRVTRVAYLPASYGHCVHICFEV